MTARRAAFAYSAILCLLYALIPALSFPTPPLDVVEGFAWGRELQLGYTKHPPMQAWLLEASFWLTGGYHFGGYVLSALSAALGYAAIWTLALRLGLTGWQAFWSVVLTSVTFYFTLPMPEFNPNILQIPVWAGMILFFHRAITDGRLRDWLVLGLIAAFGFHTKYFVLLLVGTIGLYTLVFADARKHLRTPGPWICTIACLLLMVPHGIWLLETDFLTLRYAADRSNPPAGIFDHFFNPLNFLLAQIGNHAGLLIVALAGLGWHQLRGIRIGQAQIQSSRSGSDRFLLWFAVLPFGVVLAASAVTGNEFEHMWGTPLFVLSGTLAVRYLRLPQGWAFPRRAFAAAAAIQAIFLGVLLGQGLVEPQWKTKHTRIHYPAQEVAGQLADIWEREMGTRLAYVAGDMWSAANVTNNAPGRPSMFYLHDPVLSPWINLGDVQEKGVMIVWRGGDERPLKRILEWYPGAVRQGTFRLPYRGGGTIPDAQVNWLIVPPGSVTEERAAP